jgi:indolepyruvate ferredoxin oxidoreductase beta subunit
VVVVPVSVIGSTIPYPSWDEIERILAQYTDQIYSIPATKIGLDVGNPRALNMVMLGSLSVFLELEAEVWIENIRRRLPPKFVESSLEAFSRGATEAKAMMPAKGG